MCLCTLCIGSAWGETVTSTFTNKDWSVGEGEAAWTASGASATALESSGDARGVQVTLNNINNSGLTLTNTSIKNLGAICKVEIVYSSNCSGTSDGTIAVAVGSTDFGDAITIKKENNATISFENETAVEDDIVITFTSTATSKSVYVKSITVTYEEATPTSVYTVTLSDNEAKLNTDINGKVTLPKRVSADSEFNIFAGWAEDAINEATTTAPELFNGEYRPTGDITLHPIFKKETEGEIGWTEVSQLSSITAGTYAIITTDGYAFNGSISSGHGQVTTDAFSFTNGSASSAPEGTCEITLTASGNGFTMYNADKGYLYAKAAKSGNLAWHSQEDSYWSYKKSNWIYENNSAYLRSYNNTSFRTYSDASYGKDLIFAKKGATIISEYKTVNSAFEYTRELTIGKYATMCLPCSANILGAEVYSVEGVDSKLTPTILYLTKVEGETAAGVPYIIKATDNTLVASYTSEPTENAGNANGLYGSFISATIEAGKLNYILKDNKWHYIPADNTNTVGAYKAYLNLNETPLMEQTAKGDFEMIFDGNVTSINLVPVTEEMGGTMYNLNGMKVNASYKGIVVKNGKKVINK